VLHRRLLDLLRTALSRSRVRTSRLGQVWRFDVPCNPCSIVPAFARPPKGVFKRPFPWVTGSALQRTAGSSPIS